MCNTLKLQPDKTEGSKNGSPTKLIFEDIEKNDLANPKYFIEKEKEVKKTFELLNRYFKVNP